MGLWRQCSRKTIYVLQLCFIPEREGNIKTGDSGGGIIKWCAPIIRLHMWQQGPIAKLRVQGSVTISGRLLAGNVPRVTQDINQVSRLRDSFQRRSVLRAQRNLQIRSDRELEASLGSESSTLGAIL